MWCFTAAADKFIGGPKEMMQPLPETGGESSRWVPTLGAFQECTHRDRATAAAKKCNALGLERN